jgi:hypothetical protein
MKTTTKGSSTPSTPALIKNVLNEVGLFDERLWQNKYEYQNIEEYKYAFLKECAGYCRSES